MKSNFPKQKFQDWFTQKWAIFWGKQIVPELVPWLIGPFGKQEVVADNFITLLAEEEGLIIKRNDSSHGLIPSIKDFKFSEIDYNRLSAMVIDFYENTSKFELNLTVKWNPLFKLFGNLTKILFSNRIEQLNIPTNSLNETNNIVSEIITLLDPITKEVKFTAWFRTYKNSQKVLYSGFYSTCTLPSGMVCIKAVFPLPNGNATVIMSPSVGPTGELCLNSSGTKFGEPGFYFLLNDSKGNYWAQYIKTFRDNLILQNCGDQICAVQTLTLFHKKIFKLKYLINHKKRT